MLMDVQLRTTSPRRRHAAGRDVSAILNKAEEFIFVHSLAKLSQYVIVYIPGVATRFKKSSSVMEPSCAVLSRK